MNENDHVVAINILDRHYQIKCPFNRRQELEASALYVGEQMKKLQQQSAANSSPDRLALVTALNISNALHNISQKIKFLQEKLEDAIGKS